MDLRRREHDTLVFGLSRREGQYLLQTLRHYPLTPVAHHRLSRGSEDGSSGADQTLLTEAMAAEKKAFRQQLDLFLANEHRWAKGPRGYRLALAVADVEWMLRMLNDVRVGSWLILGCPDPDEGKTPVLDEQKVPYLFVMEFAAHFQCELLAALEQPPPPSEDPGTPLPGGSSPP